MKNIQVANGSFSGLTANGQASFGLVTWLCAYLQSNSRIVKQDGQNVSAPISFPDGWATRMELVSKLKDIEPEAEFELTKEEAQLIIDTGILRGVSFMTPALFVQLQELQSIAK